MEKQMTQIISVHSFRGGTGKSNTTANLATLLAMEGKRVGIVDTDIQSPGIHVLFNLDESEMVHSLNDYLWGKCEIQEAAKDVTDKVGVDIKGKIFLIPASMKAGEIARVLREGYDVGLLNDGFRTKKPCSLWPFRARWSSLCARTIKTTWGPPSRSTLLENLMYPRYCWL